jgi:antitoxin HicB
MTDAADHEPVLTVAFYASETDNEPVRDWLLGLKREDRREVGFDIKTVQYGWPIGMPLARLRKEVAEVTGGRRDDGTTAARETARGVREVIKKEHIGGNFADFLGDEDLLEDAEAVAAKRVIAFQISQEMEKRHLTKTEMAHRMGTSRPAVDRLLDPANQSVTLSTLERAAAAVGRRLKVELSA